MRPKSLQEFKEVVQATFSNTLNDRDDRAEFFDTSKSLKAYLVENNNEYIPKIPGFSEWRQLDDSKLWYYATNSESPKNYVIYDHSLGRVGVLYTMLKVTNIDRMIEKWISRTPNLDHCWLSRKQLMSFNTYPNWVEKGIGLKYRNVLGKLNKGDDAPTLSLKAWYGSSCGDDWIQDIGPLKEKAALSSIRWQKNIESIPKLTFEWYNYGKVTVSYAEDVNEAMQEISQMARRYYDSLVVVGKMRDENLCAFELTFSKKVDIQAFSECVVAGRTSLKLWMIETESSQEFKRFRGVDLHTWDPIYIDITPEYAFLTVPMGSCVNAAPRIAVIQGENTSGDTTIEFNGDEVFV